MHARETLYRCAASSACTEPPHSACWAAVPATTTFSEVCFAVKVRMSPNPDASSARVEGDRSGVHTWLRIAHPFSVKLRPIRQPTGSRSFHRPCGMLMLLNTETP